MTVAKGFGGLRWIGLHKAGIAVGQINRQEVGFALHSPYHHQCLAEVCLAMARWMRQRHEHLSGLATTLPDVVLDYRVLAQEPVLICQAVKDTPGRVELLLRQRLIVLQDTVNHSFVRVELRPAWWLFPPVPGRCRVLQHLVDRTAVQPEHPGRLTDAHPFNEVGPTNSPVQIHGVHPSSLPPNAYS